MNRISILIAVAAVSSLSASSVHADPATGAESYLKTCLPIETVRALTGLELTSASRMESPQVSCSYSDSELLAQQSRVTYGRDPVYRQPFGEDDVTQAVAGLGRFAEYDSQSAQLFVNVGNDGLVFSGRKGRADLPLEALRALAEEVMQR